MQCMYTQCPCRLRGASPYKASISAFGHFFPIMFKTNKCFNPEIRVGEGWRGAGSVHMSHNMGVELASDNNKYHA